MRARTPSPSFPPAGFLLHEHSKGMSRPMLGRLGSLAAAKGALVCCILSFSPFLQVAFVPSQSRIYCVQRSCDV